MHYSNKYIVIKHEHHWIVKEQNSKFSIASCNIKQGAVDYAKILAKKHRPCSVEIFHANGNFEDEYIFGLKQFPGAG